MGAGHPGQPISNGFSLLQQLSIGVNVTYLSAAHWENTGRRSSRAFKLQSTRPIASTRPISHVWGLRPYDDRNDAGLASANVNVGAADSTVIAMVGSVTAPMTLAALPRYANDTFAVIVPTVTAHSITARGYHNVYRLPAKDSTRQDGSSPVSRSKASAAFLRLRLPSTAITDTRLLVVSFYAGADTDRHSADFCCSFRSTRPTPRKRRGRCSIVLRDMSS